MMHGAHTAKRGGAEVRVTMSVARQLHDRRVEALLADRKLTLVLDLDHTILHATQDL